MYIILHLEAGAPYEQRALSKKTILYIVSQQCTSDDRCCQLIPKIPKIEIVCFL